MGRTGLKNKMIDVLAIEDNPTDLKFLRTVLEDEWPGSFSLVAANRYDTGLAQLERHAFDVVLLDLELPDRSGLDTLKGVYAHTPNVPIVILSGLKDEHAALESLHRGAQDYLVKEHMDAQAIGKSLRYAIERKKVQCMKERFVGMITHELRSPITILKESVEQVFQGITGELNKNQYELLSYAVKSIDHLKHTCDELLDLAKLEEGGKVLKKERFNMVALAEEIGRSAALKAARCGLDFSEAFPDEAVDVYADREKIYEVWINLINNAFKFTSSGSIRMAIANRNGRIECRVADTGCGLTAGDAAKLFNAFEQFGKRNGNGEKGTGLGLSICREIVEMHGGHIRAISKPGRGTTFLFTLPVYSARELLDVHLLT